MRDQTIRKTVTELGVEGGELSRERQNAATKTGDAGGFGEGGMGATEGEVSEEKRRREREGITIEFSD